MNRIKEILEEKGIKQTWLAQKLGKSFNMVNSYVQNRRQPSIKDLIRISQILGVKIEELIVINQETNKLTYKEAPSDSIMSFKEDAAVYEKTIKIPLIGSVACGTPLFAVENIENHIPVSETLIKSNNKYFILRASGDSMNEAGINDGDLVLIKQGSTAENGEIVVALIDDDATIKEFRRGRDNVALLPKSNNKVHQPIILSNDFRIQGIVEAVISI